MVAHTCNLITSGRPKQEDFCEFKASLDSIVLAPDQPQLQCETLSQKTENKPQLFLFSYLEFSWNWKGRRCTLKGGRGGVGACLL